MLTGVLQWSRAGRHIALVAGELGRYLPPSVYRELKIAYILLLTCSPREIAERLVKRDKGKSNLTLINIEELQHAEVIQARKVSTELQIPLIELDSSTKFTLEDIDILTKKIKGNLEQ